MRRILLAGLAMALSLPLLFVAASQAAADVVVGYGYYGGYYPRYWRGYYGGPYYYPRAYWGYPRAVYYYDPPPPVAVAPPPQPVWTGSGVVWLFPGPPAPPPPVQPQ